MKKFKFKLETVLKVRTRLEDLRKRELRQAELRLEEALRQLKRRQAEIAETTAMYQENLQKQRLDLNLATYYHNYLNKLNQLLVEDYARIDRCNEDLAKARQNLIEATKEKKIVEKLKEKAYEEYKSAELKQETEFLDELGTTRFIHQETTD
ncbi:MAG TPA: flagellar export protein FliJ [Bacillota bacterium]|nr:flagellar export protein FliJ [Bacillota bacterium]HOL09109.1 flagellar export protein FliJ [Bacillota bacterium]HPO97166.1 flagellar export protein FliJ [Bacillota bacterium]